LEWISLPILPPLESGLLTQTHLKGELIAKEIRESWVLKISTHSKVSNMFVGGMVLRK